MSNYTHEWYQRTDCMYGHGNNFTLHYIEGSIKAKEGPCGLYIDKDSTEILDHRSIKYLSFRKSYPKWSYEENAEPRVAYIADTENHCIR